MKRIIIIISISLLLTGCLGETAKGYITKTCTKEEYTNNSKISKTITIKSKSGNIETIQIKEIYDKDLDVLDSKKSEQVYYKTENGITLDINNNEYKYTINPEKISDDIKERFNIKKEQHKQIKQYEDMGYTCR